MVFESILATLGVRRGSKCGVVAVVEDTTDRRRLEVDLRHGELQLGDRWRLGRSLKERGYAEAYVLPNTMKSALAPSFARIPLRVGYLGESRVGLLNRIHKAKRDREPMPLHYARLAEEPGIEPDLPLPSPSLSFSMEKIKATASKFGIQRGYVVLCPDVPTTVGPPLWKTRL